MAQKIAAYAMSPLLARTVGQAGRIRAEREFSMEAMSERYQGLYDSLLKSRAGQSGSKALICR